MSTLAVFLVLGGGAVAAVKLGKNSVGSRQLKENAVTASKIKNGAITGAKLNLSSLGAVPTATNATSATTATNATNSVNATNAINSVNATNAVNARSATNAATANTAATATDALSLGGVPASEYTQSDCGSISGAVKGFAWINSVAVSAAGFSTAGVEIPYNCSGGQVLAFKVSAGLFKIRFVESPVQIAVVSSGSGELNTASVNRLVPGEFQVSVWNETLKENVNGSFSILTP
jgi:hypothetical protein